MENITLEYQPIRFLKYTRKIEGNFPSGFVELQPKQLIAIAALINGKISETEFLNILTGIPKFRIKKLEQFYRYKLMVLFEPFLNIQPYDRFIIPGIKISGGNLVSPKPRLHGMTFAQFIFVESYFENYQADKKPLDLYKFVASLYFTEFCTFNEDEIRHGDLFSAKVKPEILEAIVINYILVKEWLSLAYPMVFESTREDENNEPSTNKIANNPNRNSGWLKVFENIVGDDLVNHDRYSMLPLHNVLRWMTNKIKENIKNRKK
jgi:hypothetical protein